MQTRLFSFRFAPSENALAFGSDLPQALEKRRLVLGHCSAAKRRPLKQCCLVQMRSVVWFDLLRSRYGFSVLFGANEQL